MKQKVLISEYLDSLYSKSIKQHCFILPYLEVMGSRILFTCQNLQILLPYRKMITVAKYLQPKH